ncbi:SDR family NAD(P)-dependent oxidoreductase [Actinosynnema sp. NPDC053489]|uniref:SDR family NAD(P)-dependent oxidoreductase n=1 Tax=Actinosynnema sp. NPDC053489 TaxID=3363916 RepID=UPI0037CBCF56
MTGAPSIALVGMACRYPDADGPDRLWETVVGRRRAFRLLPERRLGAGYRGVEPDQTYVTHAGLLRGWEFDRRRFRVPGALFRAVDHTHWLALQTCAEALADAGFPGADGLDRDRAGVVLGNSLTGEFSRAAQLRLRWPFVRRAALTALAGAGVPDDQAGRAVDLLRDLVRDPFPEPGDETLAGALANTIAGRVCNHFDLRGTGYTVDGACSSSLLAVATACRALVCGELDFALAGGVDLSLDPFELVGFARLGALARGHRMRVYDADPTGFLPGEGCGVVALMRHDDARRRGLRVYALVSGWGTSCDGSGGLTRPEPAGLVRALERAYAMAGVDPAAADLVEGHGTGTPVGDRAELIAFRRARAGAATRAALGSVKANLGHTKAAAGVAGLIKAALAVHHRVLPPTTGCDDPHPLVASADSTVRVLAEPEPWPDRTPVAGVSAMGFGGINAHVVLSGAGRARGGGIPEPVLRWSRPLPPHEIVAVTGADRDDLAGRLTALAAKAGSLSTAELHDLAATRHRDAAARLPFRCLLVADSPERLARVADRAARRVASWGSPLLVDREEGFVLAGGTGRRVGLLFPGQAAPVRARLDDWARDLTVPEVADDVRLHDGATMTDLAQPAIVRQSVAALALLDRWGCAAVGAVGHSLGEITALVWAGALSAGDGLRLATARGRVMARHGRAGTGMASIGLPVARVEELAGDTSVVVAGFNGPDQVTIGGTDADVRRVAERALRHRARAKVLAVSHAFHTEAMRSAVEPFAEELRGVRLRPPRRAVFSTVTGRRLDPDVDLRSLLVEQVTAPVRFAEALAALAAGCDLLVEVGPGTTLTSLVAGRPAVSLDAGGSGREHAVAVAALAAVSAIDLDRWFGDRAHRHVDLDTPITLLENPAEAGSATAAPDRTAVAGAVADPAPTAGAGVSGGRAVGVAPDRGSAVEAVPGRAPVPGAGSGGRAVGVVADFPPAAGAEPVSLLRAHLGRALELPPDGIRPDHRLLADLHLNSLQVVQLVAEAADLMRRRVPTLPPSLDTITVGEVAELIAARPPADGTADAVEGVRPWVRSFEHRWEPWTGDAPADDVRWTVLGTAPEWLHDAATGPGPGRDGLVFFLGDDAGTAQVAEVLRAVAAHRPDVLAVLHHGHPAAAAVASSAAVELPACTATSIELPRDARGVDLRLAGIGGRLRVDAAGGVLRSVTVVRPPVPGGSPPVGAGEVCLVSGGVAGITARCAQALALSTGCTLVFLGRSPAEASRVRAGLAALDHRVTAHYTACDVTDPDQVRAAVARAGAHGPVRAVLHGAGVNEPRSLGAVTERTLAAAVAPKVTGLDNLLAALDGPPALLVGFGSVIGRRGLPGQAEYCVANDWLRVRLERWAAANPGCRTRVLEWSVWSDVGMGARLGVLDPLREQGITPVEPAAGAAALLAALADGAAPVTRLVAGRFPSGPTLSVTGPAADPLRFSADVLVRVPGVEAVLAPVLSTAADPYLDDHRVDGVPVLPAVVGLEAAAQAAAAVVGEHPAWEFGDVELPAPVLVNPHEPRALRVAALARDEADPPVDVVLRDGSDGFTADRVRAVVRPAPPAPPGIAPMTAPPRRDGPHPFYGPLLFHSGRLRGLLDYEHLSAFRVRAWVAAGGQPWFAEHHAPRLLLGDPGVHDAAIHVLLACLPHRKALPVSAERVVVWRHPVGTVLVTAEERSHDGDDYVYDVWLSDQGGARVARWEGLRLRAFGARSRAGALPAPLVGPLLSRRLSELGIADRLELVSTGEGVVAPADVPAGVGLAGDGRTAAERAVLDLGLPGDRAGVVDRTTDDGLLLRETPAARVLALPGPRSVAVALPRREGDGA